MEDHPFDVVTGAFTIDRTLHIFGTGKLRNIGSDLGNAMRDFKKGLSGDDLSMDVSYDTDHGPFMLKGIPVLDLEVDMSHYMEIHHKSSDTFDKVDPLNFKAGAAIVAVTAYAIAESPKPIAPHIDHAAVGDIIKKAGLDELLKDVGVWNP